MNARAAIDRFTNAVSWNVSSNLSIKFAGFHLINHNNYYYIIDFLIQTKHNFYHQTTKNTLSELEKREKRAMERKISEMEEELKVTIIEIALNIAFDDSLMDKQKKSFKFTMPPFQW